VSSGATASATNISSGGSLEVLGGTAISAQLSSGASATISGGLVELGSGAQSGVVAFASGGTLTLDQAASYGTLVSGFTSDDDDIDFRAVAFSGSVLSWNQSGTSGTLSVSSGANTASVTLLGNYLGQTVSVTNGVTSTGLVAGSAFQSAADSAGGTDVTFGVNIATVDVQSGGRVSNTTILNGGVLQVDGGVGFAANTVLSSGATASVFGVVHATTVLSGATLFVITKLGASGLVNNTVLNGGKEIVSGINAAEESVTVNAGGFALAVAGGGILASTISGGTVEIGSGGHLFGTVSFATSGGGTLQLDQAKDYGSEGAVVSGFARGDDIDFRAIAFSGSVLSWNQGTATLSVSNGGTIADIALLGNYVQTLSITNATSTGLVAGNAFSSSSDISGGTDVTFGAAFATIDVLSGGTANSTTVSSGGTLIVGSSGSASGTVVNGGSETVSGLTAVEQATQVNSGGHVLIVSSGVVNSAIISGGTLEVGTGGKAKTAREFVFVASGGTLQLDQARNYTSESVSGYGAGDVIDFRAVRFSGSTLTYSSATGLLTISSGGTSASTLLIGNYVSGQTVSVASGVTSSGLVAAGSAFLAASDGSGGTAVSFGSLDSAIDVFGVTSNTTVRSGGQEVLSSGAIASGTIVSNGGIQLLAGSATAVGTIVSSGGTLLVSSGTISGAVLSSGATASIGASQTAFNTTVLSGGVQILVSSLAGAAGSGTVLNGGEEIVSALASEMNVFVNSGGLELVASQGGLASASISGGTVEYASQTVPDASINFVTSGGGTLQLDEAGDFGLVRVSGFTSGAFIDFQAIAFSGSVLSWHQDTTSSGTLTVSNGGAGTSASITLLGQYVAGVGGSFTSAIDSNGGTRVGDPPVVAQTDLVANPHST
jgi:autotransporter passenger strand-loop-strand repeat protein